MAALPGAVRELAGRAGAVPGQGADFVRMTQSASIRLAPDRPWRKLDATQWSAIRQPGFVWHARQPAGPIIIAEIVDAYVDGRGSLEVRLFGSVPVAKAAGEDIARAELMRYLAEMPWTPDAILHNAALRWSSSGDDTIQVEAGQGDSSVAVRFRLDDQGDIVEMQADDRPATEDGEIVLRPWRGVFRCYQNAGGRRVPTEAEVGYVYEQGYQPYYRCSVDAYRLSGA